MNTQKNLNRRDFLMISSAAGSGLLIALFLPGCTTPPDTPDPVSTHILSSTSTPESPGSASTPDPSMTPTPKPGTQFEPNLFIGIDQQGKVTITVPRMEMGQGVRTALPMILAEELEANWSSIYVNTAPADSAYGRQRTTGSHSVEYTFGPLRRAGAAARMMLIAAAAETWGTEIEDCYAEQGQVIRHSSGQRLGYGELVKLAATMPLPDVQDIQLKDPGDFRLIGTSLGAFDAPDMVTGRAVYGMDIRLPGMFYAVIARCPVPGGKAANYSSNAALEIPGVNQVVELGDDVAVLAENTWAAIQGRKALQITWAEGQKADLNSAEIRQTILQKLKDMASKSPPMGGEDEILDVIYETPFLAHATMEPMNCTADVRADRCVVWAPTQNPEDALERTISITGLPEEAVTVHIPLIGGGFGRRSYVDYVDQAVSLSQTVGAPVQVVWTREDDFQHDYFHPFNLSHATARLDDPIRRSIVPYPAEGFIPTGIWRSVENIQQAFTHECFVDELAAATGRDPYEFRREMLDEAVHAVLDLAVDQAGWGDPLPEGWGRGLAFHTTWGVTHVAQVAEVSVDPDGNVRVHRVVCAVDCGTVVNPDMVAAQLEGGIVMGLTAALKGEITIEDGRVQQRNFHDYPLLRLDEMPEIEVYILPSDRVPEGVGEMGVPPSLPAVANAVFAATGKRIRRIPILPALILEEH